MQKIFHVLLCSHCPSNIVGPLLPNGFFLWGWSGGTYTFSSHLICPCVSQRQQNALKYVTEEWASIEYELLRERGLWGPPIGSHLDKFVLEMTEGPCRMRKKMVRNDMFYIHYPYFPDTEANTNSAQVSASHRVLMS